MKFFELWILMLSFLAWSASGQENLAGQETFGTMMPVGQTDGGLMTPVNQWVEPAGRQVMLDGVRPNALALSPDGHLLVTSGLTNQLLVLDPANGALLQRVMFPSGQAAGPANPVSAQIWGGDSKAKLSYTGLVFSPDGRRIYLSNVNGDIKVFGVGADHRVSALCSFSLPQANTPGRSQEIPSGLAVSADGKRLYVACSMANRLLELDVQSGKPLRAWNVGVAPYDVAMLGSKVYVSNWGGRRPYADSPTGPIGETGTVRVDADSIASEGSVSVVTLKGDSSPEHPATAQQEIITGRHACALAVSPNHRFVVCANAGDDTVSVLDARADTVVETLCMRQHPGDPFGAQPNALAFDHSGRRLYVCNGTQNAVAVVQFKPRASHMLGLIPVGWFPGGVVVDGVRDQLIVANLKDISVRPQPARLGHGLGFNTHQYCGSLTLAPLPSAGRLKTLTSACLADMRYPLLVEAALPPREDQPPVPVPARVGEPSLIRHVIYVIKENRTYDQVLGDMPAGNGDSNLCVFGSRVTPNQHALCNDFVLLDNAYCSGILSAEGHQWAVSGIASDYVERSYAGWPRSYPAGGEPDGRDALAYSSAGFIWTDAAAHGRSVADFGEFTTPHHVWRRTGRLQQGWREAYEDFLSGSNAIAYSCEPDIAALRPFVVSNYFGFDLDVPDVIRGARFIQDWKQYEAEGHCPNLIIVWLPNDHTSATRPGSPTPEAQVADNDLALGRIVQAVSHSCFWTNTCIFATEDDPQNGWDHVSAYRSTIYLASPYALRHQVIHTQYNQTSVLRTIELMLGLPPMNQMDATATPMTDCFTNQPDWTPFSALPNQVPLDEMNPLPGRIKNARIRKDAMVSARLPLEREDECPEDLFNHILWRAIKGPTIAYPAPSATDIQSPVDTD